MSFCFLLWTVSGPSLESLTRLTFRVEGDETITNGPLVNRLVQDDILIENFCLDVFELVESREDFTHRLRLRLFRHRTNADDDPLSAIFLRLLRE